MRSVRSESTAQCYEPNVNGRLSPAASIRAARPGDAREIAAIFNQGVDERIATFEARHASAQAAADWIRTDVLVVAEVDGELVGWAKAAPYTDLHHYYDGVREATLYVDRDARRGGIGRELLDALARAAAEDGAYKLVGKIFTSNAPSIALVHSLGWREVGVHERHGTLDGAWKDVLVVERVLTPGD
jgi:L-amino acid N-acyltransferase YncA